MDENMIFSNHECLYDFGVKILYKEFTRFVNLSDERSLYFQKSCQKLYEKLFTYASNAFLLSC